MVTGKVEMITSELTRLQDKMKCELVKFHP